MGRFSEFSVDELHAMLNSFAKNYYETKHGPVVKSLYTEVGLECDFRASPAYKDEQQIREHLKKLGISEYEISAGYEVANTPVCVVSTWNDMYENYDSWHYFVYKGGVYSCRSHVAVEDFLVHKSFHNLGQD